MIKQYDKVKMKDGRFSIIVEILEPQKAYIADVEIADGEFETKTVFHSDICALMVEVEQPIAM
ncbi:MAG: hypothetical protein LBC96_06730 [Lachnospiraceae bacterium]|jgi:hypothetical protein|nr:hypothetical protein [Lachnospiraceae bacterium]